MTKEEYEWQVKLLKEKIEQMLKIHCPRVAAKYERILRDFDRRYGVNNDNNDNV